MIYLNSPTNLILIKKNFACCFVEARFIIFQNKQTNKNTAVFQISAKVAITVTGFN
jgi:hypothetical protein